MPQARLIETPTAAAALKSPGLETIRYSTNRIARAPQPPAIIQAGQGRLTLSANSSTAQAATAISASRATSLAMSVVLQPLPLALALIGPSCTDAVYQLK